MRMVEQEPCAVFYKPQGIPMRELQSLVLPVEGLEALRLVDGERMQQVDAADRMGISRPTLSRVLSEARNIVATALFEGKAIRVDGGEYQLASENGACRRRRRRYCRTMDGDTPPNVANEPSDTDGDDMGE
jgi:predicted DNA-binding protein (UPF0251 family)